MPIIPPPPPAPLPPITVVIPNNPPDPPPCPDCPEPEPGGDCVITDFFWYAMLADEFNDADDARAIEEDSGDDVLYTPVETGEEYEADPWERTEVSICTNENAVLIGQLRGYCADMGPITWTVTWTPDDTENDYRPSVFIAGGTVVMRLDYADDMTGILVVSATVGGQTYGPASAAAVSCG